jgi:hypothetical protein
MYEKAPNTPIPREASVFPFILPGDERMTDDQRVHLRAQKTVQCLFGLADDGLVLVERGVEHHRDRRDIAKLLDQSIVKRIGVARDGLKAA